MTLEEFKNLSKPESNFTPELRALWWDFQGDWNKAHEVVDQLPGKSAARIHAYLHRKEGDIWNADYWYRRSGQSRPNQSLEEEWESLVRIHLGLE